jgi:hypothetical protein
MIQTQCIILFSLSLFTSVFGRLESCCSNKFHSMIILNCYLQPLICNAMLTEPRSSTPLILKTASGYDCRQYSFTSLPTTYFTKIYFISSRPLKWSFSSTLSPQNSICIPCLLRLSNMPYHRSLFHCSISTKWPT